MKKSKMGTISQAARNPLWSQLFQLVQFPLVIVLQVFVQARNGVADFFYLPFIQVYQGRTPVKG